MATLPQALVGTEFRQWYTVGVIKFEEFGYHALSKIGVASEFGVGSEGRPTMNQQGFDASGGASALKNLFGHYDRTKMLDAMTGEYKYVPYMNLTQRGLDKSYNWSDIDDTRTHLNYNLAPERDISQAEFLEQRLSEIYVHKSALKNALVDWVVTLPDLEQYEGREREFFEVVYDVLADKYGHENVVSAYVHMDEKQPHMHFAFVPVVKDEKHEQGFKLSKKAVNTCERVVENKKTGERVTKVDTREFSAYMHAYVEQRVAKRMGFEHAGVVLTEEQKGKRRIKQNMKVRDLVIANRELDRLEELQQAQREQLRAAENELASLTEQRAEIAAQIASEAARLEYLRQDTRELEQEVSAMEAAASAIEQLENARGSKYIAICREITAGCNSAKETINRGIEQLRERINELRERIRAFTQPQMSLAGRVRDAREVSHSRPSRSFEHDTNTRMEL